MSRFEFPVVPLQLPEFHSPKHSRVLIFSCMACLFILFVWSAFASVEEVTRGTGRVIPSQQMQVVQAPERGIVSAVLFHEGEVVGKDDVVLRLDNSGFSSQLGELLQKRYALQARVARLQAEASHTELSPPNSQISAEFIEFFNRELEVFKARKTQLASEIAVLRSQLAQKEQDLKQIDAETSMLMSTLSIITRELEINEQLYKRGVLPEVDFLRLKRQHTTTSGELEMLQASRGGAVSAREEALKRVESAQNAFASKAQSDLVASKAELAVIAESLRGAEDRVNRSALIAPVRGVINKVNVSTLGAVVQAGEPLVEIVPLEDTLLVAAKIKPQDVAFLHKGQSVTVKVTAYDYSIYGGLEGKLERISADTTDDERGQAFFKAIVRTKQSHLGLEEDPLPITPGMTATIDILTGKKSVLSYLIKPLKKVKAEAFRER